MTQEKPKSIEIPFGAKDSEFIRDEYLIPEGCEARIEGNKVIIEKIQKKEELTEFEVGLLNFADEWEDAEIDSKILDSLLKKHSKILLDLARKEILKDLPKWKEAKENRTLPYGVVKIDKDGKIIYSDIVWEGEYFIMLQSLKSLPKEE